MIADVFGVTSRTNVAAAALFLKNVASAKWANRQETKDVPEIRSYEEIDREIEAKILELQAAGYIDITPREEENGKRVEDTKAKKARG